MIILYGFFVSFVLMTTVIPIYLICLAVGTVNPKTRGLARAINNLVCRFIGALLKLALYVVVCFTLAIVWIDVLKLIILPPSQWEGPLSFLPLIKSLFTDT